MPFHIVCLETGETFPDGGAVPAEWLTGADAAAAAETATRLYGKKYKPRRVQGDPSAWKKREQARFDDGIYTKLPWHDAPFFRTSIGRTEHFAHVSKEKPGMVAYTETPERGEADIRTRVKPGTYLSRYFADKLTKDTIQELARKFAGQYELHELKFATTEDEIAHVYITGPRSCMSGPETGLYQSPVHPARAYAGGDLAVAYMERGGSIIARAVVWPEKKIYATIYGDYDRMVVQLRKAGYKEGRLTGAKLKRIPFKRSGTNYLVVPHIDSVGRVTDHGDHLTIGGNLLANATCGLIHCPDGTQCSHCATWGHDRVSMQTVSDLPNRLYCGSCLTNYTYLCEATNVRYGDRDRVYRMGPDAKGRRYWWSVEHFRKHGLVCGSSGIYLPKEELTRIDGNGMMVATHLIASHTFECQECKKRFDRRARYSDRKLVCVSCASPPRVTLTSGGTTTDAFSMSMKPLKIR